MHGDFYNCTSMASLHVHSTSNKPALHFPVFLALLNHTKSFNVGYTTRTIWIFPVVCQTSANLKTSTSAIAQTVRARVTVWIFQRTNLGFRSAHAACAKYAPAKLGQDIFQGSLVACPVSLAHKYTDFVYFRGKSWKPTTQNVIIMAGIALSISCH